MVNLINIFAALISFAALTLLAVAMATNWWVSFDFPRPTAASSPASKLNPSVINSQLDGLIIQYDLDYFGLWVGCHRELTFNKISCAFITTPCRSNVCWTRNDKDRTCQESVVSPLSSKCTAYRATRALTVLGTVALVVGAAIFLVSTCITSKMLVWTGTAFTALATILVMCSFAVFYGTVFRGQSLNGFASLGWSFIMLIISWPLAGLAAVIGLLAAFATPSRAYDYDESE